MPGLSVEDAIAQMQYFVTAVQQNGQFSVIEELVHPDFVDHTPAPNANPGYAGVQPGMAHFHACVEGVHVEILSMISDGKTVATHKILRGRQVAGLMGKPATMGPVEMRVMDFITIVDGKFKDHWATTTGPQDVASGTASETS